MSVATVDFGNGPKVFFNGTPHPINVFAGAKFEKSIRKWGGGTQVASIPMSGCILNADLAVRPIRSLGGGVEICEQVAIACDPLPDEARSADYIIVSAMYGLAYRQMYGQDGTPLLVVRDVVVSAQNIQEIVGCRGFATI